MISVAEAKRIISNNTIKGAPAVADLNDAAGLVLAEDVWAAMDFPPFRQSAMDGYAIRFAERSHQPLQITGEIQAGSPAMVPQHKKQAVRIFTGAPVPDGFDTVLIQEKVRVDGDWLYLGEESLTAGSNIRPSGSEMRLGERVLPAGTLLTPGAIGLLAGAGQAKVKVYMPPSVAIIVTGHELREPGERLQPGQVYESNSFALRAALKQCGAQVSMTRVDDNLSLLREAIDKSLAESDVLLITGGMSVGDYDFGAEALQLCGVESLFYKIKQKPGKPMLFGKKGSKIVFGLPGNPSSVLTCFYEYVLPCIRHISGWEEAGVEKEMVCCTNHFTRKPGLTQFLKGRHEGGRVTILDAQESYRMRSFAYANCLVMLDEEVSSVRAGDMVEVHKLPQQ